MKTLFLLVLICISILVACNSHTYSESANDTEVVNTTIDNHDVNLKAQNEYEDGSYCALVEYFNPHTGKSSEYTLKVEIENDELTIIHWPNGGWLDDSHFTPPDISDGEASFISDADYEYDVHILDNQTNCNPSTTQSNSRNFEISICPKCGNEKLPTDKYCDNCKAEICPRCGGDKFPTDDLCDECQEKQNLLESHDKTKEDE